MKDVLGFRLHLAGWPNAGLVTTNPNCWIDGPFVLDIEEKIINTCFHSNMELLSMHLSVVYLDVP
jgi:hypothetical protein